MYKITLECAISSFLLNLIEILTPNTAFAKPIFTKPRDQTLSSNPDCNRDSQLPSPSR